MIEKRVTANICPSSTFSLAKKAINLKTLASAFFGLGIIFLLLQNTSWADIYNFMAKAKIGYLLLAFLFFYSSILLRAIRWNLLLNRLRISKSAIEISEIYFLSWFANCVVPGKIGDLYRAYLIRKNYGHSISQVVGSIFIERFFDLIIIFSLYISIGIYWFRTEGPGGFSTLAVGGLIYGSA